MQLPLADTVVLLLYLALITGLGIWLSRFQTDSRAYFLGNRNIPWPAVCLSVVATETSVLTFIGVPALAYATDMQFLQLTLGYLLARIVLAWLFLPRFLERDTYTVYGFLTSRFGNGARNSAAALFMLTQVLGSGVRLYAAALVLATVLGTENIVLAIVVIAIITILYTWAGGISAVIWTDVLQAGIMIFGGVLGIFLLSGMLEGGLLDVLEQAAAEGRLRVLDFSFSAGDPYTFWSGLAGGAFLGMASHGTDQMMAQRLLTSRNLSAGRKAIIGSGVIVIPLFLLFLVVGVLLHYFYQVSPPAEAFDNPDRIFPHFIVNHFPPVAAGLVIASMFGAAMSTLDSGIQALSSSSVMDLIRPLARNPRPAEDYLGLSRLLTVFWGAVLSAVAIMAGGWGPVLETGLKVASFTYGPLLGLFMLGFFSRVRSQGPVVVAVVLGLAVIIWVILGTGLAWSWYVMTGCLITVAAGLLLDRVRPGPPREDIPERN